MDTLHIRGLGVQINGTELYRDFDLTVRPNEKLAILGPSGCGKSTLLRIMAGLLSHQNGELVGFDDQVVRLVFQEPRLLPWKSVRDNIALGCQPFDTTKDEFLNELLDLAELSSFQAHLPHQLSGGMAQRVSLLRAMVTQPDVLLLDEPFSSLDRQLRKRICQAYLNMCDRLPHALILVTHQPEEAFELADRIVVFNHRPVQIVGNRSTVDFGSLTAFTDWLDHLMAPTIDES